MIQLLVECGALRAFGVRTDWGGDTALREAASHGKLEVAKFLLAQGVAVEVVGQGRWSALHVAVHAGHSDLVRLLLDNGAQVNRKCNELTPLDACHSLRAAKRTEIEQVLIEFGGKCSKPTSEAPRNK